MIMSEFIQYHILTTYPPSNLNRDDMGYPKSVMIGNTQRLRISSQALKYAWRNSNVFEEHLLGHISIRTRLLPKYLINVLVNGYSLCNALYNSDYTPIRKKLGEKDAEKIAVAISELFGEVNKKKMQHAALFVFSPHELSLIDTCIENSFTNKKDVDIKKLNDDLTNIISIYKSADIAMFGRMSAKEQKFTSDAAIQVGHAFTVHACDIEDDYFTAVDDLESIEDAGSAHLDTFKFGAGIYYLYICVNRTLLLKNCNNDENLVNKILDAFTQTILTISPGAKQNSFASRAYANYVFIERGNCQPRNLANAFIKPIAPRDNDILFDAIEKLNKTVNDFNTIYGLCSDKTYTIDVNKNVGTLHGAFAFLKESL